MKKNTLVLLIGLIIIIGFGLLWWMVQKPSEPNSSNGQTVPTSTATPTTTPNDDNKEPNYNSDIKVDSFQSGATVSSPLTISGSARGTWFFEASFPIDVIGKDGKVIAQGYAEAQEEWMTANFVPFKATITFNVGTTQTGEIVLKKDNPSGLSEHDKEMRVPVILQAPSGPQRTVKLFFYNPINDQDVSGNTLCSNKGLVTVDRQIPVTNTPIQDAIKLLLRGEISFPERQQGISTEYPLAGVELKGAALKDSVFTLEFTDPNNKTSGGSCRTEVLWAQIEATAKQFPEIKEVKFKPEDLFQP